MDHSFTPSQVDPTKCAVCRYGVISHTDMAECEACPNKGGVTPFNGMLLCQMCIAKEKETHMSPERQQARVDMAQGTFEHQSAVLKASEVIDTARSVDQSVQVRTDLFNAHTVAIQELKESIDKDDSIQNKPYALAEILVGRFTHFKQIIFEMSEEIVEKQNQQRAIQSYLNTLANSLRKEERDRLKIQDMNYKPESPASVKERVKASAKKKKAFDKEEVRKYAEMAGVPEIVIQMTCVQRNVNPQGAYNILKANMDSMK